MFKFLGLKTRIWLWLLHWVLADGLVIFSLCRWWAVETTLSCADAVSMKLGVLIIVGTMIAIAPLDSAGFSMHVRTLNDS